MHSNCFEITVELSCCKYPPTSQLQTEWNNNLQSLLNYTEAVCLFVLESIPLIAADTQNLSSLQVHMGIYGFIRDKNSRKPVPRATISVAGEWL